MVAFTLLINARAENGWAGIIGYSKVPHMFTTVLKLSCILNGVLIHNSMCNKNEPFLELLSLVYLGKNNISLRAYFPAILSPVVSMFVVHFPFKGKIKIGFTFIFHIIKKIDSCAVIFYFYGLPTTQGGENSRGTPYNTQCGIGFLWMAYPAFRNDKPQCPYLNCAVYRITCLAPPLATQYILDNITVAGASRVHE